MWGTVPDAGFPRELGAAVVPQPLTQADVDFLLESLRHTERQVEATTYPTYELHREQMTRVEELRNKLRTLRSALS